MSGGSKFLIQNCTCYLNILAVLQSLVVQMSFTISLFISGEHVFESKVYQVMDPHLIHLTNSNRCDDILYQIVRETALGKGMCKCYIIWLDK